ncbi:MAG: hypothetical protein ABJC28_02130 [Acidobacteriota bacterium]
MKKSRYLGIAAAVALAAATVACKKKVETATYPAPGSEPPVAMATAVPAGARIERVTVVKAVNSDDSPGEAATTFGPKDTVYVSMWTASAPVGTQIAARWFGPNGQQITEDKIVTDKAGDGYTSFHAANTKGWAPGTYRVDILLNGAPAGSTTFTIS